MSWRKRVVATVHLDEVAVALLCDPVIRDQVKGASGSDPDPLVDLYVNAINRAVAGCPPDLTIGVHMCRGNFKGHYLGAGGYKSVAERFFANTKVNHFLLEYDTARAGDTRPTTFRAGEQRSSARTRQHQDPSARKLR